MRVVRAGVLLKRQAKPPAKAPSACNVRRENRESNRIRKIISLAFKTYVHSKWLGHSLFNMCLFNMRLFNKRSISPGRHGDDNAPGQCSAEERSGESNPCADAFTLLCSCNCIRALTIV